MSSASTAMAADTHGWPASKPGRVNSLDVMRGITMAFMVMVNNQGPGEYFQLHHSEWDGITLTDLVFPTFLFIVGVSIVLSVDSRHRRDFSNGKLIAHACRRAVILILLGLVVNGFPFFHLGTLRIYGVLQRIGICYFIATLLYVWRKDVTSKIVIVAASLIGYWCLIRFVPVPGLGIPGKNIPFMDKNANLAAYLDRHIFPGRLLAGMRDPEGLLSDLPALGTTVLGVLTGMWIRSSRSVQTKFAGLGAAGVLGMVLGLIWNVWFPINKRLWTSSFVLFTAGVALLLFAFLYYLLDVKRWTGKWEAPWMVYGTNAIFAYVLSELLYSTLRAVHTAQGENLFTWIYSRSFAYVTPTAFGALLYSIAFTLVCWLIVLPLYRRKLFIKV